MAEPGAEEFAPSGGRVLGGIGIAGLLALVVYWAISPSSVPDVLVVVAVPMCVLIWASTIRPRVRAGEGLLALDTMFTTVRIPLAAVEAVSVAQVLTVRTARRRYTASGVSRSARQLIRDTPSELGGRRSRLGAGFGSAFGTPFGTLFESEVPARGFGMPYGEWVEVRLRELIKEDQHRRGIGARSAQAEVLAGEVRRVPAWPEVGAMAASLVFAVVVLLVSVL